MSIVAKRVLLVLAMASMMIQAVNAGPVSRELEDRGDDVGVPKTAPKTSRISFFSKAND